MEGDGGNSSSRIEIETDVHIMRMKGEIEEEKKCITRTICAINNFGKRGVIRMKNVQHHGGTKRRRPENVTWEHLGRWKKIINQEVKKLSEWNIHEFCSQPPDSEYLFCYVDPAPRPITFEYNLHVILACGNTRAVQDFDEALAVLTRNQHSAIQASSAEHLRSSTCSSTREATTPNLKTFHCELIGTKKEKIPLDYETMSRVLGLGDVLPKLTGALANSNDGCNQVEDPSHFSETLELVDGVVSKKARLDDKTISVLPKLSGALANSNGGCIQVDDPNATFELVDGVVSREDQDTVTRCLTECFNRKIHVWGRDRITPEREDHWDVMFPTVGQDGAVFTIRVKAFYGGVFEKEPVAYTLKNGGRVSEESHGESYEVARMEFDDWFNAMLKQHNEDE